MMRLLLAAAVPALFVALPLYAGSPNCYHEHALLSDQVGQADHLDTALLNAWGIAFGPNGYAFVADNHSGQVTSYDGSGIAQTGFVVPAADGVSLGSPTGIVANSSSDFVVSKGLSSGPAQLLVATEDGTISGWNPAVDAANAIIAVNRSSAGAIYKGIEVASNGEQQLVFATDFHNGRIDIFDKSFAPVTLPGSFQDPGIKKGFAPFGIHNIGGVLYVTYAKQDANRQDDVHRIGLGYVNVFDANGFRLRRLATRGHLNGPWGVALAPEAFAAAPGQLLVGNFGDGRINAFDLESGHFTGALRGDNGKPLSLDGLWGIVFGNNLQNQSPNALFFAAGPVDEAHGLYGRVETAPCPTPVHPY